MPKTRPPHAAIFRREATAAAVAQLFWIAVFTGLLLVLELQDLYEEGWDESTFIIMASHVLEGNLPYLELYEVKPPGIFFALAAVMAVFGENLPTVHLFGAFCLLVCATAGYAIAVRQTTPLMAGAAMAAFCALTYEVEFQQTMTEHLALAFLMPACWLLAARPRLRTAFLIGLLISCATLTRTNLAYVAVAVGGVYLWRCVKPRSEAPGMAVAAYVAGGALPLTCLFFAYWLAGGLDTLVMATVEAPLFYASSQFGMMEASYRQMTYWLGRMEELPFIFLPATVFIICGVALLKTSAFRGENGLLLVVLAAVSLSIACSGAAYGHYLLQALPLALILAVIGFGTRPRGVALGLGLSILIVGGVAFEVGRSGFVPYRPSSMERMADLIRQDRCCGELVYASRHHLIYWYLNQPPPSRIVHPSVFARTAFMKPLTTRGYVTRREWWLIFERDIGYIVLDRRGYWRRYTVSQRRFLTDVLKGFHLWMEDGELAVYRRNR